ncbi:MAG: DUF4135 domain-containing protein [Kofleriaceae bacterium]
MPRVVELRGLSRNAILRWILHRGEVMSSPPNASDEGAGFRSALWHQATTLRERIEALRDKPQPPIEPDQQILNGRLDRWRCEFPYFVDDYLSLCSTIYNTDETGLAAILGQPLDDVRERAEEVPRWLRSLEHAFSGRTGGKLSFTDISGAAGTTPFLNLIEPLIRHALLELRDGVAAANGDVNVVVFNEHVEQSLLANAQRQLLQMLIPTLVLELNVARVQGLLRGDTPEQRFASFVDRLREPDAAVALLSEYPALARQLVSSLDHWMTFSLEFLNHFAADRSQLCIEFGAGKDLGTLVSLDDSKGDAHRHGRSVLILTFSTGTRIVYKPRPLGVARHFQELLSWLNERGADPPVRTLKVLDRGAYGWVEFVSPQGCSSPDEVKRFYTRQGELLALLYAIEATDFHFENLIAVGEHPAEPVNEFETPGRISLVS